MSNIIRKLRLENKKLKKEMTSENRKIYIQINEYISSFEISVYDKEKINNDICLMILEGQRRNESVSNIIGDDYKNFCDDILKEVDGLTSVQKNLVHLKSTLLFGFIVLLWLCGTELFGVSNNNICSISLQELGSGIFIASVSTILQYAINRNTFFKEKTVILALVMAGINLVLNFILFTVPEVTVVNIYKQCLVIIALIVLVAIIILSIRINKFGMNKSIKRSDDYE